MRKIPVAGWFWLTASGRSPGRDDAECYRVSPRIVDESIVHEKDRS
jgi:hypothetical protein